MMKKTLIYFVILAVIQFPAISQNHHKLDSLQNELKKFEVKEKDMERIAEIIDSAIKYRQDEGKLEKCAKDTAKLVKKFPLYPELG